MKKAIQEGKLNNNRNKFNFLRGKMVKHLLKADKLF